MAHTYIIGSGGHGRVVRDILRACGQECSFAKLEDIVRSYSAGDRIVVADGDNFSRARIVAETLASLPRATFAVAVHPTAVVAEDVVLNEGSVVMAGAVVNCGTRIGAHCIVNTASSIDHNCVLGDFVSVAPGAHLGGTVEVGAGSAIGIGAAVVHRCVIGENTVVGAGAVVVKSLPPACLCYGNPARVIRPRAPDEKYL